MSLHDWSDAAIWAEALRRGLIELDGTGYASTTERTPPGDTPEAVLSGRSTPGSEAPK